MKTSGLRAPRNAGLVPAFAVLLAAVSACGPIESDSPEVLGLRAPESSGIPGEVCGTCVIGCGFVLGADLYSGSVPECRISEPELVRCSARDLDYVGRFCGSIENEACVRFVAAPACVPEKIGAPEVISQVRSVPVLQAESVVSTSRLDAFPAK